MNEKTHNSPPFEFDKATMYSVETCFTAGDASTGIYFLTRGSLDEEVKKPTPFIPLLGWVTSYHIMRTTAKPDSAVKVFPRFPDQNKEGYGWLVTLHSLASIGL